jgi:GntR family transcriptional regulator, transcriptional repressor for pyruvate dehydrogenase complex
MTQDAMFRPAQVGRAGEDIALQIEAAILGGKIPPGDRLPSERELQIQFHTGRGVIREALGALKQKGLIDIRKGAKGGAVVKNLEMNLVSASLALFLKQQQVAPNYLIEVRESLDRSITTLAIARATADEKASLVANARKLVQEFDNLEPDMESVFEIDRDLNLLLAQMTKNPVFEWIMRAMQSGLSSYDHSLYASPDYRKQTAANWLDTAIAIARGEPLLALSYIGYHYVMLRHCVAPAPGGAPACAAESSSTPITIQNDAHASEGS